MKILFASLVIALAVAMAPAHAHVPEHCMVKVNSLERVSNQVTNMVKRGALGPRASAELRIAFNNAFAAQQYANKSLIFCIAGLPE